MNKIFKDEPCPECGNFTNRGVTIDAVIIKDQSILLIKRGAEPFKSYWATPGGYVGWDETIEEVVKREVKEETNLDVLKCKFAFDSYNEASKKDEPFYFCEVSDGVLEIVGEEKDKHSPENWYHLEWIELSKLKDIWLVPEAAKDKVIELQNSK